MPGPSRLALTQTPQPGAYTHGRHIGGNDVRYFNLTPEVTPPNRFSTYPHAVSQGLTAHLRLPVTVWRTRVNGVVGIAGKYFLSTRVVAQEYAKLELLIAALIRVIGCAPTEDTYVS